MFYQVTLLKHSKDSKNGRADYTDSHFYYHFNSILLYSILFWGSVARINSIFLSEGRAVYSCSKSYRILASLLLKLASFILFIC